MKLLKHPDMATIRAGRGKIDYYEWKGIPVARTWPRWKPRAFSAGESAAQLKFTAAAKGPALVDEQVKVLWRELAKHGTGESWVDGWRAAAMGNPWVRL